MITEGTVKSVLVVAADLVSRFIFTGFSALQGLTASTCRPFDNKRDGLVLGDGGVAILLMEKDEADRRGFDSLARISGWGIANDANHITGPAKDGRGLISAIRSAVSAAEIPLDQVEAYCAHGTGTSYNDAMELTAVDSLFGDRGFPIFSVKGAIGHTLGAAGAIETAIAVCSLKEKRVPPTVGLINPDANGLGRVSNTEQGFGGTNILTTNSGFGGCNAALLLERP
jgi:3-oxoacyl-[acyl-carrier-protein] synthase II